MGTLGKILLGLMAAAVFAVIVGGVLLMSNLDAVVAGIIETAGSNATGTAVTVGEVHISLQDGSASISDLGIANPEGFSGENALHIDSVAVALNLEETGDGLVVLKSVLIDGAKLTFEQRGSKSNLQTLLDRLDRGDSAGVGSAGEDDGDARVIVDEFRFLNARASLAIPAIGEVRTAAIPDVSVTGVGRKSAGVTAAEAARQVLEPVIREAVRVATRNAAEGIVDDAKDKAMGRLREKAADKLRGLLNGN